MKTKNLIVTTIVCVCSIAGVYAQKVEAALVEGCPVINCTDMPAAAITTTPKGSTEAQLKTGAANATVFSRFAVAKADNSTSSNWFSAFGVCSSLGAKWRLPTQRELMLMGVLQSPLENKNGFTKFLAKSGDLYWSATEDSRSNGNCWYVHLGSNTIGSDSKTTTPSSSRGRITRCVKEL